MVGTLRRMTGHAGRSLFGIASLAIGVASLALSDQLISNWRLPGGAVFLVSTSLALVVGGAAVPFAKTGGAGAIVLGGVYLLFALTFVPDVFARPAVYASWGDVFYEAAPFAGAVVAYALASPLGPYARRACRAAILLLGLSEASFAVEQIEFLARTASLVPKWMPPGAMFWALATTVAFALAGVATVTGFQALLATRLAAAMLTIFGIAVWIPTTLADPATHANWSEGLETFAIAGATLVVAEFLSGYERSRDGLRRLTAETAISQAVAAESP